MKLRHRRKQFWWTWKTVQQDHPVPFGYVWITTYCKWGVARIKHQIKDKT
jgi:hypothetical protein